MLKKDTIKNLRIFIFITAISSCISDDDEIRQGDELLGSCYHGDPYEIGGEYTLIFYADYYGFWGDIIYYYHPDGDIAIGVAIGFSWSTTNNPKTLIIPDMKLNTPYSINAEGQLILNNFRQGKPFDKIE